MKLLQKISLLFVFLFMVSSCDEHEFPYFENNNQTLVQFSNSTQTLSVDLGTTNTIDVEVGVTSLSSSDRTYAIEVVEDQTTANSSNYSVPSSVTVPADSYLGNLEVTGIDNDDLTLNGSVLVLRIVPEGNDVTGETTMINITKNCPIPDVENRFAGNWFANSPTICSGDGEGNCNQTLSNWPGEGVHVVTITDSDAENTYTLSDITGGLYSIGYGDSDQPGDIVEEPCNRISMTAQPDTVYGGDEFNGTGTIDAVDANGVVTQFTLQWSNNWGDQGTTVYTRI